MKRLLYFTVCVAFGAFYSCGGSGDGTDGNETDTTGIDTSLVDTNAIDTSSNAFIDTAGYVDEEAEIESAIEEKYGVQWDFCDCVVKNDSVNKAIDNAETDDEFDRILARMDVIDSHCKEMLTTPNTTPDERKKHERKVNKCLKDAGVK